MVSPTAVATALPVSALPDSNGRHEPSSSADRTSQLNAGQVTTLNTAASHAAWRSHNTMFARANGVHLATLSPILVPFWAARDTRMLLPLQSTEPQNIHLAARPHDHRYFSTKAGRDLVARLIRPGAITSPLHS